MSRPSADADAPIGEGVSIDPEPEAGAVGRAHETVVVQLEPRP